MTLPAEVIKRVEEAVLDLEIVSRNGAFLGGTCRSARLAADLRRLLKEVGGGWRPTHRHVKRGTEYEVLGTACVQTASPLTDEEVVIVYQDAEGVTWIRRPSEFNDSRFEAIPSPPTNQEGGEG